MSTEKSFLDDNGLQRLWQKITATVTNSISAAINALPSWAKSETKPSYTVSEISDAVSDEDFVAHTNDMTLHLSTDDRQDFSEITRYHKEYYNLPTPASSDKKYSFTSFDFGYVGTEIEGVAIDQTGKIYYCPNEVGNWYEYGNQLPDGAIGGFSYSIAIYNMQLYVAVMKNGDQCIWKLGDEGWTKIISYSSGSNHQIQVYGMFVVGDYLYGFGSDTYLLRISSDNTYEFIEIPNAHTDPNGDGSTSIHKAKATDDHTRAVLFDTINHTVYKLDGTTFSTPITYSSSITVTDIAPIYSQFGFFCVVLDYTDDIIYAVTSSGFMVESSGQMALISGTPGIGVYQSSQDTNPIIVLISGINGYYQENFPSRGGWKNLTIGGTPNSLDTVACVHYATYSNKWFAIDENGKCIICSDLTSKWKNYRADVMDKSNNFISDEFRETIGAMDETGVAKFINEASAGLVKYDVAQSLTNAQKTQARSNIGAESLLVGDIKASLNRSQPDNWLKCDGSPIRISDYPKLGEAIGASVYKTSTSKKIGDSSIYYNAINVAYKSNVFCEVDGKYYYPLLSADRKTVTIVSIADDGSSVNTHGTITTSSGTAINTTSNIVWCWNTYNIVLFTVSRIGDNTLTLTYYIAKGNTPDASSWFISGPYTLTNTINMPSGISGCDLAVTSDGNNLIMSIGYHDSDGWQCAIAIIPYSLSSARMQHLAGPSTYNRMVSIEYVDHKYFLNKSDSAITDSVTNVENKIAFFRDIDSISIEYINLDLPSPYQLTAFSFYGFLGVQKIGSKFRAYLIAREDVMVNSSTKYIRSIYVYESNTSDFATYTTKVVYRDVYRTNASFQYLIDSGLYIYLVYDYYNFTQIVVIDPNDPTSYLGTYMAKKSANNLMLWDRWKVLSMMPDSDIIKIISGVFSGNSSPYTLNVYIVSFSDPEKFAVLPNILKDSQGYRYIKAGD